MTYINLSQFRDWVKKNQGDIALVIGFMLVAVIAFGAGRLSAPPIVKNPIIVENSAGSGNSTNLYGSAGSAVSSNSAETKNAGQTNAKGMFVGSKNSNLYHWPWCAPAKNIKPENEVWFQSEVEARAAGRSPSSCVASQAPAGYVSQ